MTFRASLLAAASRKSLGTDLMVTITQINSNHSLLLTAEEARQLAFVILRETDKFLPRKEA